MAEKKCKMDAAKKRLAENKLIQVGLNDARYAKEPRGARAYLKLYECSPCTSSG